MRFVLFVYACLLACVFDTGRTREVEQDSICDTLWKRQTNPCDTLPNGLAVLPGAHANFVREWLERFTGHFTGSASMDPTLRYVFRMENKQSGVNIVYDDYPLGPASSPTALDKYVIVIRNPIDAIYESMDTRDIVPEDSSIFDLRLEEYKLYYTYWLEYAQQNPQSYLLVEFNTLLQDTLGTLERIAAFMGDRSRQLHVERCVNALLDDCTYPMCRALNSPPGLKARFFSTAHIQAMQTEISSIIRDVADTYNAANYAPQAYDA